MSTNTKNPEKTQLTCLPLFSWRPVLVRPSTRAGEFVARRYRVDPALADVIAHLAGFQQEAN